MATMKAAWGIEIGAYALKAIRLEREGDSVSVTDFTVIPHRKVLSTPDIDAAEIVRFTLGDFMSQKQLQGEHLVMSVPGHSAFARFAKLPPVEPKKVPDIVKFEAVQQIPFPIDEVEWDYQTFTADDSPEVEVGIFAITRQRVQQQLGLYSELNIGPEALTLSPVAVFNAMSYDCALADRKSGPVVFLDIGTQATDVVIVDQARCWIRTFPLGGTHFTDAIAKQFNLSYAKAEKLKLEASTSQYAKQIMQAMRPVFSDLLQDLQRSIGYYQSVHRDRKLTEMVGIGSTFKIPGLRKFIGQQLQIEVGRLDEFRRISVAGRDSAAFSEHVVNFATAYGLALQGVGLAPIDVNLVPTTQLREQVWHSKSKWFVAAAAVFVAGAATSLYHPLKDSASLPRGDLPEVVQAISAGEQYRNDLQAEQASATGANAARNMVGLLDERRIWPFILNDVASALRASDPQPVLLGADVPAILGIAPEDRRLVELTNFSADYAYAGDPVRTRRLSVVLHVELTHKDPVEFLNSTVAQWLRDHADPSGERADVPYRIVAGSVSCNPTSRLTEIVGEDGRSTTAPSESGSGNRSAPPPKAPPSAPAPPRPAPGAGAGGNSGGGGPGGFGFGGGGNEMGRRQTSGTRRAAPGSDLSGGTGFGTGSSGGGDSPSGGGEIPAPPAGGDPFSGTGDGGRESDLNRLAPISEPAPVLPAGAVIYRLPITFDIEIIERVVIPPPQADARGIPSLLEGLA